MSTYKKKTILVTALFISLIVFGTVAADEIQVAVASNFTGAIKAVSRQFEKNTRTKIVLMFGSTGKHYAQIRNGAPFDLFFAADVERPELLEGQGVALPGSRFTYAIGKLVLWSAEPGFVDPYGEVLKKGDFHFIAIANPKLAPYGKAAQDLLLSLGLWEGLSKNRLVRGENISQTFQFVNSRNAKLGFVALSQVKHPGKAIPGSWWEVPQSMYSPIEQQAVQLRKKDSATTFLEFVQSDEARKIINAYGYSTP